MMALYGARPKLVLYHFFNFLKNSHTDVVGVSIIFEVWKKIWNTSVPPKVLLALLMIM